jgi:hypothetical protein
MTTLAELTLEEQRLAELMGYLCTVDKEAWQRASRGVFDRYREVHRQYAALARLGDVEALRRAAFLQWFFLVEPPFLTGVADLDSSATDAVIELLELSCRAGDVDSQLRWMLPYYAAIADWWFDAARAPALATFCIENRPDGLVLPPADFESVDRGQLGTYWASLHRG